MAKIKNWSPARKLEGKTKGRYNEKKIVRAWRHDQTNATVQVQVEKRSGEPDMWRVLTDERLSGVIDSGVNRRGEPNSRYLTREMAIETATEWMRNHPNP